MRALMWFRADLRVRDNTALFHACQAADNGVLAVFVISPAQWAAHDWGSMKVDFFLRNLGELREALAALNIPLKVLRTDTFTTVPQKLLHLARTHGCGGLFFNREYEVNELARDRAVTAAFEEDGRSVQAYTDQVILEVVDIRSGSGGWYTVFTAFKRKWCAVLDDLGPPKVWPKPRRQVPLAIAPDDVPGGLRAFAGHCRPDLWPAGERAAGGRLKAFVGRRIDRYHSDRDVPAADGTSGLSPYLAAGVISPRQCLEAALTANHGRVDSGRQGPVTWITELIWREFYRYILIGFPRVCRQRPFQEDTDGIEWHLDEVLFEAWCRGRTGFPIVDAAMRQLAETGWMHNRLRMIVATFLTKDLFIDWRRGERYFMQHLVDGDFASNNGGWQWSASTGTDAAPYFRIFSPTRQSRRFDPQGAFIRRYLPELADLEDGDIHEPHGNLLAAATYPKPIVDRRASRERVLAAFKKLSRS